MGDVDCLDIDVHGASLLDVGGVLLCFGMVFFDECGGVLRRHLQPVTLFCSGGQRHAPAYTCHTISVAEDHPISGAQYSHGCGCHIIFSFLYSTRVQPLAVAIERSALVSVPFLTHGLAVIVILRLLVDTPDPLRSGKVPNISTIPARSKLQYRMSMLDLMEYCPSGRSVRNVRRRSANVPLY